MIWNAERAKCIWDKFCIFTLLDKAIMSYNFNALPKEIQEKVNEYIEFLLDKYSIKKDDPQIASEPSVSPRMKLYGAYQGKIKMSPDFDEPLSDFEDYM